jgi:hypothetical protein
VVTTIDRHLLDDRVIVRESTGWSSHGLTGNSVAVYSPCEKYRYMLTRCWDASKPRHLVFVGLNPSTATENVDDPTIRKLVGYANRWGLGGLTMLNFFAFRSTDPKKLPAYYDDANGIENDGVLRMMFGSAAERGHVLAFGWGAHGGNHVRSLRSRMLTDMALSVGAAPKCFGYTGNGQPKHPLYLKNDAQLIYPCL